ncbi:uncharacterized protein C8A04DRAFT_35405 [Dichotomopilus funicola]|uniref:Uncharacterized protein n=1 Tax=Dichotomopilus funicola TaxID=1934379 RepID=A0AAN6V7F3_9PEZI|nr:hypothetical protein C8A04DRAFT_35405 [Dichotomopilus funicola]
MAATFDTGLEAARQDFPEVSQQAPPQGYDYGQHHQQQQQLYYQQQQQHQQYQHLASHPSQTHLHPQQQQAYYYDPPTATAAAAAIAAKVESPPPPSSYGSRTASSPFSAPSHPGVGSVRGVGIGGAGAGGGGAAAAADRNGLSSSGGKTILGCSLLVFILSCIIGLLSAGVIGLAAATGIESQRASTASSSLASLSASLASATAASDGSSPTGTSVPVLDDGFLGAVKFTRYCNRDAPNPALLSLFTADFDTCMDACSAYNQYLPPTLNAIGVPNNVANADNATCEGVSFIPAWTSKVTAEAGKARGNCYLKPGPQNRTGLVVPNIGVDCHAAILTLGV